MGSGSGKPKSAWQRLWFLCFFSLGLAMGAGYFLLCTTAGAALLVKTAISWGFDSAEVRFRKTKGAIIRPLTFYDVEIQKLEGLPAGTKLKVQELRISDFLFHIEKSCAEIRNARLVFPKAEYPVVLWGTYKDLNFNVNVYSKSIGVRDMLDLFAEGSDVRNVSGLILDMDSFLKGSWRRPQVSGSFFIDRFLYKEFSLSGCPVSFDVKIEGIKDHPRAYGEMIFQGGTITSRRAKVLLEGGKMTFSGNPKTPELHFQGASEIEGVKINITLKGTLKKPKLALSSDPPVSQENLLLMLMTGKRWGVTDTVVSEEKIPIDIARDFVDYFVFSGMGESLSKRLGVDGVSLTYSSGSNELGVSKTIADKVEIHYGIEKPTGSDMEKQTETHKVGAEVKITDKVSIEAEGQVHQPDSKASETAQQEQKDGKVVLKYKKKF